MRLARLRRTAASLLAIMCLVIAPVSAGAATGAQGAEPRVIPRFAKQVAAAQRYAQTRDGRVGWALINHRGVAVAGWRMHHTFQSASVFKTMLAVCFLNDPRVRARALTAHEARQLRAMITRSDDPAANWIYGRVRQSCIHRLARKVGMRGFQTSSHWGRTKITPLGTARLFFQLEQRIVRRHRARAMRWFEQVVPSQRWGIARRSVVPRGMRVAFKGGFSWSMGGGRTVNQGARLEAANGHRIALAVLTNHSPSQAYGEQTLEGIGSRLLRGYRPLPAVKRSS